MSQDELFLEKIKKTLFECLSPDNQNYLKTLFKEYGFTSAQLKIMIDIGIDFEMWKERELSFFADEAKKSVHEKMSRNQQRDAIFKMISDTHERLQKTPADLTHPAYQAVPFPKSEKVESGERVFGMCPVASPKTVCCNLRTIDAVQSCALDCSYCSIQSFYNGDKVLFENDLTLKLQKLGTTLDKNRYYHFGTGQSSDSLLWGNESGLLDALFQFAKDNPNIVLEFKTKTSNVAYLLQNDLPANILTSFSLNTNSVVNHEEHLSSSLTSRLSAARKIADKGGLVAFHFHPMMIYKGFKEDYAELFNRIQMMFHPDEIGMISFGTLTFIKPAIKAIRSRKLHSKILQMPLIATHGKYSYSKEQKIDLFSHAYDSFKAWHDKVYFYLCMEDQIYWEHSLKRKIPDGFSLEDEMNEALFQKIGKKKGIS